jgi:hypothetical protein
MLKKISEREETERFIQDLKVNARDVENYSEKRKLKEIILKFQKGFEEEYTEKYY